MRSATGQPLQASIRRHLSGISCTVLLLLFLALNACSADGYVEQRHFAMATWVDIAHASLGTTADAALEARLNAFLQTFSKDYYAWADGELHALNVALSNGEQFTPSPRMLQLLNRARGMALASSGYFDPGVGALVELWGFHSEPAAAVDPERSKIEAWLQRDTSIELLLLDDGNVSSDSHDIMLDLGGIAKGFAVDLLIESLLASGLSEGLVNAGGDVRVLGSRDGRPWRIGIQAPRSDDLLGILVLSDGEAVFTSGDYERFYEADGNRRHHLLDPTTGYPATHTQAVTVIAPNGTLADAAATAIFVAGPLRWQSVAGALGISAVLRVDASGNIEMTQPMRDRLNMQVDNEPATIPLRP